MRAAWPDQGLALRATGQRDNNTFPRLPGCADVVRFPVPLQALVDLVGEPQQGELAQRRQVADAEIVGEGRVDLLGLVNVAVCHPGDAVPPALFRGRVVSAVSFWLGRISYSAYLFHIVVVMAVKPRVADWPLVAQLALYLALVCALSTVFWRGFERPILARRPGYAPRTLIRRFAPLSPASGRRDSPPLPLAGEGWGEGTPLRPSPTSLALALALSGAGALAREAFMGDRPYVFYPSLVAAAILAMALAERAERFAGGLGTAARALFLFALALPIADALYRSSTGVPIVGSMTAPTYSYRAARENPAAFAMWWFYYLSEWIRDDGVRGATRSQIRRRSFPSSWFPGAAATCSTRRSGSTPPASAGRRSRPTRTAGSVSSRSANSQTFGPTLRDGEKPWPELLQALFAQHASCGRTVEVVNAERKPIARRQSRAHAARRPAAEARPYSLDPRHERPACARPQAGGGAERARRGPRASALIGRAALTIERAVHDWRARRRRAPSRRRRSPMRRSRRAATPRPIAS